MKGQGKIDESQSSESRPAPVLLVAVTPGYSRGYSLESVNLSLECPLLPLVEALTGTPPQVPWLHTLERRAAWRRTD